MNAPILIGKKIDGNIENNLAWVVHFEPRLLNFDLWLITQSFRLLGCGESTCSMIVLDMDSVKGNKETYYEVHSISKFHINSIKDGYVSCSFSYI